MPAHINSRQGNILVIVLIVIASIIAAIIFLTVVTPPSFLIPILRKVKNTGNVSAPVLIAKSDKNIAQLFVPEGALASGEKFSINAINVSADSNAIGGMYEIEPSGKKFDKVVKIAITLSDVPKKGFSLGYWHADSKEWERIPTIARTSKTFEGFLIHSSRVGGFDAGQNKNGSVSASDFDNLQLKEMMEDIKVIMDELQLESYYNDLGDLENDPRVQAIMDKLDKMADIAISNCNGSKQSQMDYLNLFTIVSAISGGSSVEAKMGEAWDKCSPQVPEEETAPFVIKQTDTIDLGVSVKGVIDSSTKTTINSDGIAWPSEWATAGKPGWKSQWEVVQKSEASTDTAFQLNRNGVTSNKITSGGDSSDWNIMYFDLTSVKEGDTFPVSQVRGGVYEQSTFGSAQTLLVYADRELVGQGNVDPNSHMVIKGGGIELKGKLTKDLGVEGAIIEIGEGGLQGEKGAEVARVAQIVAGTELAELAKMTISGKPIEYRIKKPGLKDDKQDNSTKDDSLDNKKVLPPKVSPKPSPLNETPPDNNQ